MPLLLLIPIAIAVGYAYATRKEAATRQLSLPGAGRATAQATSPATVTSGAAVTPIVVLGEFMRTGERPPSGLVLAAISCADAAGDHGLAVDLAREFFAPPPRPPGPPMPAMPAINAQQMPPPPPFVAPSSATQGPAREGSPVSPPASAPSSPAPSSPMSATALRPVPIPNVPGVLWRSFVAKVERCPPNFTAPHHLGRFRARKDRLRALGFDLAAVSADPEMQLAALEADVGDAYDRLLETGDLAACVGRPIEVPPPMDMPPDAGGMVLVTLSGILGVAQAAGLDGTIGWLESYEDRRKYPHTTKAFLATNGEF